MRRPTTGVLPGEYAKADLFGAGKHGFTGGTPGVEAATVLSAAQMNHVAEELAQLVEGLGRSPLDATRYNQVSTALRAQREASAVLNVQASVTVFTGPDKEVNALAINPTTRRIVAVGESARIATSDDCGVNWTARTAGGGFTFAFNDVVWAASLGLFVAVGAAGAIQTSPDGETWTARTSGTSEGLTIIAFDGATLMTCGGFGGTFVVRTSTNGTSWSAGATVNSGNFTASAMEPLGGGKWALCGVPSVYDLNKYLYLSSNGGASWSAVTLSGTLTAPDYLTDLAQCGGVLVAMVNEYEATPSIVRSTDQGATWTAVTLPSLGVLGTYEIAAGDHGLVIANVESYKPGWASYDLGASFFEVFQPGFGSMARLQLLDFGGCKKWAGLGHFGTNNDVGKVFFSPMFTA